MLYIRSLAFIPHNWKFIIFSQAPEKHQAIFLSKSKSMTLETSCKWHPAVLVLLYLVYFRW